MFTIQEIPKASDLQFLGVLAGIVLLGLVAIVCYFKYGLNKPSEKHSEQTSGEKSPEYWQREFDQIKSLVEESKALIHDFTVRREPQWDNLNEKLDRINQKFHDLIDNVAEIDAGIKLLRDKK